jgi:hypothetical protein
MEGLDFKNGNQELPRLAVGVDGVIAVDNIKEACTGDDTSQCEVISYKESGGFIGSLGLGVYGGNTGAAIATSIALFLGGSHRGRSNHCHWLPWCRNRSLCR